MDTRQTFHFKCQRDGCGARYQLIAPGRAPPNRSVSIRCYCGATYNITWALRLTGWRGMATVSFCRTDLFRGIESCDADTEADDD